MNLRDDVAALAALTRDSAGTGEAASARWLAARLLEVGARDVAVEPFRYQSTYALAHGLHALAGLLATRVRKGSLRAALALAALASLEFEVSGRNQWLRRLLPAGTGHNVVARLPAAAGGAQRTLVLVAHHDAAQTGLIWHPALAERGAARRLRRRRIDPFLAPTAFGLLLAAVSPGRHAARALLLASLLADADIARSPTVPGASDNATGVAACLELARRLAREPLGADVLVLFCGCEESGMGGMDAFLQARALDPAATLVLGLDTLGAGTPIVCSGEGAILEHRYRDADLELLDAAARRRGLAPPQRWRIGAWTDPVMAVWRGIPALSLLSIGPRGLFTDYHRLSDTAERVDWSSVEHCVELAWAAAREWAPACADRA
ncbi:MAG: M28 family metallopeptidase [Solirubrobacteraceae bacterium]